MDGWRERGKLRIDSFSLFFDLKYLESFDFHHEVKFLLFINPF